MNFLTNEKTNHNYATNNSKKIRTAVVGCGAISDIYLTNMIHRFRTWRSQPARQDIWSQLKKRRLSMEFGPAAMMRYYRM